MFEVDIKAVVEKIKTVEDVINAYQLGEREFVGLIITGNPPDFSKQNLKGIKLRECTIINAIFKNTNLTDADLKGSDLSDSVFVGAVLKNANLSDTNLSNSLLEGAKFDNTNLRNANLTDAAYKEEELKNTDITGATLESLTGKHMTAEDVRKAYNEGRKDFTGVIATNQNFSDMKLPGIILKKANLHASYFDNVDFTGAILEGAEMTNCSFRGTRFENTNCSRANFFWSLFDHCIFDGAKFRKAKLTWCKIRSVDMAAADITDADFSWSLMEEADMSETQLLGMSPNALATVKMEKGSAGEAAMYGRLAGTVSTERGSGAYGAIDTRSTSATYGSIMVEKGTGYKRPEEAEISYTKKKIGYN